MPVAIIELIVVIILITLTAFLGSSLKIAEFFLNGPSFLITFGGTMAAALVQFSSTEIFGAFRFLRQLFFSRNIDHNSMTIIVIELASLFRDKGKEGIKAVMSEIKHPVLIKAIDLFSSELEVEEFSESLQIIIKSYYDDLKKYERVFNDMGVYAPMFGLLGTLIGLVQLLRELSDPATIAPNMAIALVTTLYGIALAGFVFMPISGKIKAKSDAELRNSQIIYDGFMMMRGGIGPFAIEQKLRAYMRDA